MRFLFTLLLFAFCTNLDGQGYDSFTLGDQEIQLKLDVNKPIIAGVYGRTDTGYVELAHEAQLWLSGIDFGGTYKVNFYPPITGFEDVPNSGKIWRVTATDIINHLNDFKDNGIIDNPIPSIFSWPGYLNPYSQQLNGFSTDRFEKRKSYAPFGYGYLLGFGDEHIGYRPDLGDFPAHLLNTGNYAPWSCEILFMPFHFQPELTAQFQNLQLADDGYLMVHHLQCCRVDYNESSVHLDFVVHPNDPDAGVEAEEFRTGMFLRSNLGGLGNERLGTTPTGEVYFYQRDTTNKIPKTGIFTSQVQYYDGFGDSFKDGESLSMPILEGSLPAPTLIPNDSSIYGHISEVRQYTNLLWRDVTPLTPKDLGYNPGSLLSPTFRAYTGNPVIDSGWIDPVNLTHGRDVLQLSPFHSYKRFHSARFRHTFSWLQSGDFETDFYTMRDSFPVYQDLLFTTGDWFTEPKPYTPLHDWSLCNFPQFTNASTHNSIVVSPNPVNQDFVNFNMPKAVNGVDIKIFSATGKLVLDEHVESFGDKVRLNLKVPLPKGLNIAQLSSGNDQWVVKFINMY